MKIFVLLVFLMAPFASAQVCNGSNDTAMLQTLLDRGGKIVLPEGTCGITGGLFIRVDGTEVTGRNRTVFRRQAGYYDGMIYLPARHSDAINNSIPSVKNVRISNLFIDGNGIWPLGQPSYSTTAIAIVHAENVLVDGVTIIDQFAEAIGIGVGRFAPRNIEIRGCRIVRAGRNGVHFGYGDNLKLINTKILDTPSYNSAWGRLAGNGVDVEVEGIGAFVSNFLIANCEISREHLVGSGTAGAGIALQNAYGPISHGLIADNTIRNHQTAVLAYTSTNVTIDGNQVMNERNWTDNIPFAFVDTTGLRLTNNYVNTWPGPSQTPYGIRVRGGQDVYIGFNKFFLRYYPYPAITIEDHNGVGTAGILMEQNRYNRTSLYQASPNATGVVATNNQQVP